MISQIFETMEILKQSFIKYGNKFTQVIRSKNRALYKREIEPGLVYWEVFQVRSNPERMRFNKMYPAAEYYPGENSFGITAWCCSNYEKALTRYNNLKQ